MAIATITISINIQHNQYDGHYDHTIANETITILACDMTNTMITAKHNMVIRIITTTI